MITDINSEDRLVQTTFAYHLENELGWENIYAWNQEDFGPDSLLGRADTREVVLKRDLRRSLTLLNPELPAAAVEEAITKLAHHDVTRSLLQHNQSFYSMIRDGVPVSYRNATNALRHAQARVIDFQNGATNGIPGYRHWPMQWMRSTALMKPSDVLRSWHGRYSSASRGC
jgi:type I restriction enzyme R subunit